MLNDNQILSLIALYNKHIQTMHSGAEDEWEAKLNAADPGSKQHRKAERKLAEATEKYHEAVACVAAIEQTLSVIGLEFVTNEDDYAVEIKESWED